MSRIGIACVRIGVSVWLALTLAFFLLRVLPGDVAQAQGMQAGVSSSLIEDRRQALGLDRPLVEQYTVYLSHVLRGELGNSLVTGESVMTLLLTRGANTLRLAIGALFFAMMLGLALGTVGGFSYSAWGACVARGIIDLLIAMPIYVTGTVAVMSGWVTGTTGAMLVLGLHSAAPFANTLSLALLGEANHGYIVTAHAKGLPKPVVFWRHRLRVVLHTLIPVLSIQVGFLLGGTVITEAIFSQTGLGQSLLDGVLRRDYPVVQGWVLLMAFCQAVIYPVGQLATHWLDPRQREAL